MRRVLGVISQVVLVVIQMQTSCGLRRSSAVNNRAGLQSFLGPARIVVALLQDAAQSIPASPPRTGGLGLGGSRQASSGSPYLMEFRFELANAPFLRRLFVSREPAHKILVLTQCPVAAKLLEPHAESVREVFLAGKNV